MIKVNGANGETFEFPDGTSPDVMREAIEQQMGGKVEPEEAKEPAPESSLFEGMASTAKAAYDTVGGVMRAGGQGLTMGAGDEINAGLYAAGKAITGDPRDIGDIYDSELQQERDKADQFAEEHSGLAAGAEITGALLSPITKALGALKVVKAGSAGASTVNAAAQGVAGAVPYVFLSTDGDVVERMNEAASVAVPAALFGVVGSKVFSVGTDVFKKVFLRSSHNSTTETLKASKNAAYQMVKDSNIRFSSSAVNTAKNNMISKIQKGKDYSSNNKLMADAIGLVDDLNVEAKGRGVELIALDKTQQALWKKYATAKRTGDGSAQSVILDTIDAVGGLIDNHPSSSEIMSAAKLANRRYKKAETFDRIANRIKNNEEFRGVSPIDQTKAALVKMLDDPRALRNFDEAEVARFKEFLADNGTVSQKVIKQLGTLSPTSRLGLLLHGMAASGGALSGGATLLPQAGIAAVAQGAKSYAQRAQNARAKAFTSEMQGNPRALPREGVNGAKGAVFTNMNNDNRNKDAELARLMYERQSAR